jgi:hypothetical protein
MTLGQGESGTGRSWECGEEERGSPTGKRAINQKLIREMQINEE